MPDKNIREGGYQPTKDPPARPPSVAIRPASPQKQPSQNPPAGSNNSGSDDK